MDHAFQGWPGTFWGCFETCLRRTFSSIPPRCLELRDGMHRVAGCYLSSRPLSAEDGADTLVFGSSRVSYCSLAGPSVRTVNFPRSDCFTVTVIEGVWASTGDGAVTVPLTETGVAS